MKSLIPRWLRENKKNYFSSGILDIASIASGLLMILAFAPFGYWPLLFISLLLFVFVLSKTKTLTRAVWRGGLFGLSLYGVGLHWLFAIGDSFSSNYQPIIDGLTLTVFILLACYIAFLAIVLVAIKNWLSTFWMVAIFPFLWMLMEWARSSWFFTANSLYQPSYSLVDTPLKGYAPLGGELLVTLVALALVSAMYLLLRTPITVVKLYSGIAIVLFWVLGWSLNQITWGSFDKEVSVRVLHGKPDQRIKFRRYYAIDTIKNYLALSSEKPKPALVIWPESTIAYNFSSVKKTLVPEAKKLQNAGIDILLGTYLTQKGQTFNTIVQAATPTNAYYKTRLIPFGEYTPYIPFFSLEGYIPKVELGSLTQWDQKQSPLIIQDIRIASAICFEILFSRHFRSLWRESDLLVFSSDLNWFEDSWAIEQLQQVARLRSLESAKPLLSSTNFGITSIIDSKGKELKRYAENSNKSYIDSTIILHTGNTPYAVYGNWVVALASLGLLIALFISRKFKKPLYLR